MISWSVSRTVVRPVADAAYVSERIAAGDLDRRMRVIGEDEVARLGTAFNHMAASLQDQITQLNQLSAMQQRFVSDVSHELRTPLTTVRMAAEVIHDARESFDPLTSRSAELMYNQIERFQNLLNDLLEVSRFDAGVAVLDRESTDLNVIARKVIDTATPVADEYGSVLRLSAPAEAVWPKWTRGGSSGSCATWCSTPPNTGRATRSTSASARMRTRWRSRCATTASG